jgi:hypothetical protein
MPELPQGWAAKHTKETASVDDPAAFYKKADYLSEYDRQRAGTRQALESLTDADLDRGVPEPFKSFLTNWGDLFNLQGSHVLMHCGQWAMVRRKLGRPPLF